MLTAGEKDRDLTAEVQENPRSRSCYDSQRRAIHHPPPASTPLLLYIHGPESAAPPDQLIQYLRFCPWRRAADISLALIYICGGDNLAARVVGGYMPLYVSHYVCVCVNGCARGQWRDRGSAVR